MEKAKPIQPRYRKRQTPAVGPIGETVAGGRAPFDIRAPAPPPGARGRSAPTRETARLKPLPMHQYRESNRFPGYGFASIRLGGVW